MVPDPIRGTLATQAGVISRRQLARLGCRPHDLQRLIRRRELAPIHPGVYVEHTAPPTWEQRAWAAVLATEPAVLIGASALRAFEGPPRRGADGPIEVGVHLRRRLTPPAGIVVRRLTDLDDRALWNLSPPRIRVEHALLDVASALGPGAQAVAELTEALGARRTTPHRLLLVARGRSRLRHRDWITSVVTDAMEGTCSALEHAYLTRVERPHGLRRARGQVRDRVLGGVVYRDVEYEHGLVVELDGQRWHRGGRHDSDLDRDLWTATTGRQTVRLG